MWVASGLHFCNHEGCWLVLAGFVGDAGRNVVGFGEVGATGVFAHPMLVAPFQSPSSMKTAVGHWQLQQSIVGACKVEFFRTIDSNEV